MHSSMYHLRKLARAIVTPFANVHDMACVLPVLRCCLDLHLTYPLPKT